MPWRINPFTGELDFYSRPKTQLIYGIQYIDDMPYMQDDGEARLVYKSENKDWYFNEETHEIEMR